MTNISINRVKEEDVDIENGILVCVPFGYEAVEGSKTAECYECGRMVVYGPAAPPIPRKICINCFEKSFKETVDSGEELKIAMTDRQMDEVNDHFKKEKKQ